MRCCLRRNSLHHFVSHDHMTHEVKRSFGIYRGGSMIYIDEVGGGGEFYYVILDLFSINPLVLI